MQFKHTDDYTDTLRQSLVDPALFVGHGRAGRLFGIICVRVDGLLIAFGDTSVREKAEAGHRPEAGELAQLGKGHRRIIVE